MSAANPILAAQTAAVTAFPTGGYNATEYDQFVLTVNTNALVAAEVVNVFVLDSTSAQRALINPATGTAFQLTATLSAIVLPGGYLYSFGKLLTASAVGVDVLTKPRAAFAA